MLDLRLADDLYVRSSGRDLRPVARSLVAADGGSIVLPSGRLQLRIDDLPIEVGYADFDQDLSARYGLVDALQRAPGGVAGAGGAPGGGVDGHSRPPIPMDLSTETLLGGVGSRERGAEAVAGAGAGVGALHAAGDAAVEGILQATT